MKKLLLAGILFSGTTFAFANTTNLTINETDAKIETVCKENCEIIIEYKIVEGKNGAPPHCYYRECSIVSQPNGSSGTVEVKICGEWVEIECPDPKTKQPLS